MDKLKKIICEWTFSETKHNHTSEIINHNGSKSDQPNLPSKTQNPVRMNLIVPHDFPIFFLQIKQCIWKILRTILFHQDQCEEGRNPKFYRLILIELRLNFVLQG